MSDRALLARLAAGPASGSTLARELGITRAAVWKRIESLRAAGVEIEAGRGRGYALSRPVDLLDAPTLAAGLGPDAARELATLSVAFEIDSTNAAATREAGPARGTAVHLAERQTAGRGRRGRAWASPLAAHLYMSLSRRFDGGVASVQGLSLATGVACAGALRALGFEDVGLKWPNDLLARGRKLGGILVEIGGDAGGALQVVVGIGINIAMPRAAAATIDQPWIDLATLAGGAAPPRAQVATALLDALLPMLARFEHDGLAPLLDDWARLDLLAGRPVRLEFGGGRTVTGIAAGIAADGALRIRGDDGERQFHAGEASLRAA